MSARRREPAAVTGATAEPDVDVESLSPVESLSLDRGFEVEDADVAPPVSLAGAEAPYGHFKRVRLTGVALTGARLRGLALRDVVMQGADASNLDLTHATADRARFADCRMTGVDLAEADLRDVRLTNCKLDYANLRMASLSGVTFQDCALIDVDFGGAKLDNVRFDGCELRDVEFANARLHDVDLRASELRVRGSATALSGAIVSPLQLMELAAMLAHEAGIRVEE